MGRKVGVFVAPKWNLATLDGWKVGVLLAPKWNMGTLDGWMDGKLVFLRPLNGIWAL